MKLRDILKILAIALLIESITLALKHPFYIFQDSIYKVLGENIMTCISAYYTYISMWMHAALYTLFASYIIVFDSLFPSARFGKYFRFDMLMVILSTIAVSFPFDNILISYILKIILELVAVGTAFMAGVSIYGFFKNTAMRDVCISYLLLSIRHLTYATILTTDLFSRGINEINKLGSDDKAIMTDWALLMPIFILSRYILLRGILKLQTLDNKPPQQEV